MHSGSFCHIFFYCIWHISCVSGPLTMWPEYFHSVLQYINITTTMGKLFYCTALHIYYSFSYVFSTEILCSSIKMFVRGFQPPRKNHDRTKTLVFAPYHRCWLPVYSSTEEATALFCFFHSQTMVSWPPRLILYTLCRRPDFYRLQTNGLNSIHKVNWLYLQQLQR